MVMSYTTLVSGANVAGSIANWLNHDLISNVADAIILDAESYIYRNLRHFRMLKQFSGSFVVGQDYISMPEDYLEDKILFTTGNHFQKMKRKTMEEVIASYSYDGSGIRVNQQPMIYFNDADSIRFDSPSDKTYVYSGYYFSQPASLASVGSNFITKFYPRLMRCVCCAQAAEYMKDAGQGNFDRTYWAQMAAVALAEAQKESDRSVRSMDVGMILE